MAASRRESSSGLLKKIQKIDLKIQKFKEELETLSDESNTEEDSDKDCDCHSCHQDHIESIEEDLAAQYFERYGLHLKLKNLPAALNDYKILIDKYETDPYRNQFFRDDFLKLAVDPKNHDLAKGLQLNKEEVLDGITNANDNVLQQRALWQALLPDTLLGAIFYFKRGDKEPSTRSGNLNQVAKLLTKELSKPNAILHIDSFLINKLAANIKLQTDLKIHFPLLFKNVMECIVEKKDLLPEHLAPSILDEKKSEAKGSGLTFFKKIGNDGKERFVCTTIAKPSKEGEIYIPFQQRRALNDSADAINAKGERKPLYDETGMLLTKGPK